MPGKKIKLRGFKDSRPNEDPSVQDASPVKAKCGATRGFADIRPDVEEPPQEQGWRRWVRPRPRCDVLTLPVHEDLDLDLVSALAEAWKRHGKGHGPDTPIFVRRVKQLIRDEEVEKFELVAGAYRLRAAILVGLEHIPCRYVQGDETEVRIVQIEENLYRKELTALQHAEQMTEWVGLIQKKGYISGQRVQKRKLGRPTGGISEVARQLPLVARTIHARRKIIERGLKIGSIAPAAKKAAVAAGLDNNGRALLQIAKAGGRKAQLREIKVLAEQRKVMTQTEGPPTQPTSTESNSPDDLKRSGKTSESGKEKVPDTTFEQLELAWKEADVHKLWAHTPIDVRQEFVEFLLRARCKSTADVAKFIQDVFTGRDEFTAGSCMLSQNRRASRKILLAGASRSWVTAVETGKGEEKEAHHGFIATRTPTGKTR